MPPRRVRALDAVTLATTILLALHPVVTFGGTGERPFDAESATLAPAGGIAVEIAAAGATGSSRVLYPEDNGSLVVLPILGLRAGLGPWGEVRVEGETWQRFRSDSTVSGPGDWNLSTKVRLGSSPGPLQFAGLARLKIPVASDNDGLGTNLADVELTALATVRTSELDVDLNLGVAILGAPFRERAQIDIFTYAACLRRRFTPTLEAGIELAGREGGDFFPARSIARAGIRWDRRRVRWDAALGAGLANGSPDLELRLGATLRFERRAAPAASGGGTTSGGWTGPRSAP